MNSKDYRRTRRPDGTYIYMKKNEYGDWELIDSLPGNVVLYIHNKEIWNYCTVKGMDDMIFKRGEIDNTDHYFSKKLTDKW